MRGGAMPLMEVVRRRGRTGVVGGRTGEVERGKEREPRSAVQCDRHAVAGAARYGWALVLTRSGVRPGMCFCVHARGCARKRTGAPMQVALPMHETTFL